MMYILNWQTFKHTRNYDIIWKKKKCLNAWNETCTECSRKMKRGIGKRRIEFATNWRTLCSAGWVMFNHFFLIVATDRGKISSDHDGIWFDINLYPLSFFVNIPFKFRLKDKKVFSYNRPHTRVEQRNRNKEIKLIIPILYALCLEQIFYIKKIICGVRNVNQPKLSSSQVLQTYHNSFS